MPGEIMLINPRRKKRAGGRKRRTMSAAQKKYFGKRRSRRAPTILQANPRRRRYTRRTARRVTRFRRNPMDSYLGGVTNGDFLGGTLMPAATGAAGALALDVALGYLPLPDAMTTGPMNIVTRIAGAIGIGMIGKAIGGKRFGENMMAGAIVVTLYDVGKEQLADMMSGGDDGSMGWINPAPGVGMYVDNTIPPGFFNGTSVDPSTGAPFGYAPQGNGGVGMYVAGTRR